MHQAAAGELLRGDLNWLQAPLAAGAQHGHSGAHSSAATPSTGAGSTATGKPLPIYAALGTAGLYGCSD